MEADTLNIRLKLFLDKIGVSSTQFADSCGIPRPTVSQLLSGRNKTVSDKVISMIHSAYPQLSIIWLMFGEGSMLVNDSQVDAATNSLDDGQQNLPSNPVWSETGVENPMNMVDENGINAVACGDGRKYSAHDVLAAGVNATQPPVIKEVDVEKIAEKVSEKIENSCKNSRKVVRVTVFYDDGSYQTFE